jgi:hypothetical protein
VVYVSTISVGGTHKGDPASTGGVGEGSFAGFLCRRPARMAQQESGGRVRFLRRVGVQSSARNAQQTSLDNTELWI